MRGRTGHENKTVNTYCKHRLRPTLLIEYVAEFWPPSLQPSMDVALVNATLETDQGGSIMRTDGVRVVPAVRPREVKVAWQSSHGAAPCVVGYTAKNLENMARRCYTRLDAVSCASVCEQKCIDRRCIRWEWLPAYLCDWVGASGLGCRCTWISIGVALHGTGSVVSASECIFAQSPVRVGGCRLLGLVIP